MPGRILLVPLVLVLALCVLVLCAPAAGQTPTPAPPPGRVEVFGGFSLVAPRVDSTLTTAYAPTFRNATATSSSAGQTLQLSSETGYGVELGVNYFVTDVVGLQVLFGADRFDLGGSNGPYTARLEYISRMPPDSTPHPAVAYRLEKWPDTVGQLKQRTLSVNVVGRWPLGQRVVGQVSGGLSYFRMDGLVSPVGYSSFSLGGHSVLFYDRYELEVALDAAHAFGINAGAAVDVELSRAVALTADFRYFTGGTITSPVAVTQILNEEEVIMLDPLETIEETLRPPPVELKPTRARFMAGIKVRF